MVAGLSPTPGPKTEPPATIVGDTPIGDGIPIGLPATTAPWVGVIIAGFEPKLLRATGDWPMTYGEIGEEPAPTEPMECTGEIGTPTLPTLPPLMRGCMGKIMGFMGCMGFMMGGLKSLGAKLPYGR